VDLLGSNALMGKPIEYGGEPVKAGGIEGRTQESTSISRISD
jgi:hypothetical protein